MAFTIAAVMVIMIVVTVMAAMVFVALTDPVFTYKINRPSARVVTVAVFGPVLLVAWWYVEVNRWLFNIPDWARDQNRLRIDEAGLRKIANINLAIHTGLIDPDRYTDGSLCKSGSQGASCEGENCESFHAIPFRLEATQRTGDARR